MKFSGEYTNMLLFDLLAKDSNMFHFMTTRLGGVSEGEYTSFNISEFSGDNPEHIDENRKWLASKLGIQTKDLIFPYQIHQDKILKIDKDFLSLSPEKRKEATNGFDALVTNISNICIGVSTADCVPILAYDSQQKVLATIHAGWRGTLAQIAPKTIRFMIAEYSCEAKNILVGIGACISQKKFEVGEEVVEAFQSANIDLTDVSFRHPQSGKCHIDLQQLNKQLLTNAGILPEQIEIMPLCTFSRDDLFFSARRQGIKSGRMFTGGMITER